MFSNTTRIEIQFGDCDPAGIVYYPNYFRFFDNATAALLSAAFKMHKRHWIAHHGIVGIPMVDTGAKFSRPSRFGDIVEIRSEIADLGRSSFGVHHTLFNEGEIAIEAHEKRVWVGRDPHDSEKIISLPIPDDVRATLG
ncbi:acyl-CoA thioesterase [Pelagibacterium halotolerans]|uniref:4-hydroxybenzoyl-CoA thioesterase family active site protein n=1 Tax=Pelagibacterium halotolerans (strain DSM 22347 / JCM 15775 / CGMCC 1.7692 / B2) TaxID=1082931 RepID=G4R887_PELHB|nr:thioesterase family protein [Pelagibacterium halotolerans]AEQ52331.1 4-hydroxybenzoyl-CoA thioesterase family active site protein [Pelagibacterium halotolerans B2]QJR17929.1 acyl-CoA thioesterase [Pelagibacterium halotolerans]SEA33502.1 4-hydroxybenzoyl-CoA thioesterase [Pelagibacterium halotolerans]